MLSSKNKAISILASSVLAFGTCIPASLAFADDPPPSVGGQSGAGSTDMTMVWENPNTEYMGYGEDGTNNPDTNPQDDLGDNLAFKAPTAINFVAKANGDLIAPSYSAVYIENFSSFGIHVSSMQIEQGTGWNIVENAAGAAAQANAVWGNIGPYNERLNWYDHKIKADVTTVSKWGMAASGATNNQSKLFLATEGKFANLNIDLSEAKTFGTIHWYLKMGGEGQRAVDPATVHALNKPTTASENGTFTLKSSLSAAAAEDLGEAVEGDTVYIVAGPESGYVADEMNVTTEDGGEDVSVTRDVGGDANVGSFTMPDEAVEVEVTFKSSGFADSYTMSQLQTASAAIRGGDAAVLAEFLPYAQSGAVVDVTLANGSPSHATLVDVHESYGLVFMLDKVATAAHHDSQTNAGGWTSSDIRTSLQSGTIYATYLNGMTMSLADPTAQAVVPAAVTTYAADRNGGSPQQLATANDTYFLPSIKEVYAPTSGAQQSTSWSNGSRYETSAHQFAYFKELPVSGASYSTLAYNDGAGWTKDGGVNWWLRSAFTGNPDGNFFFVSKNTGAPSSFDANNSMIGVMPCFAL